MVGMGRPRKNCGHAETERRMRKDGAGSYCLACQVAKQREFYATDPEYRQHWSPKAREARRA